jgi:hypothetical protein
MTMPVPVANFVLSKLSSAALMVIITQVWTGLLFFLSGKL